VRRSHGQGRSKKPAVLSASFNQLFGNSPPANCFFLGLFTVELLKRGPVLRSYQDSDGQWSGDNYLEAISGPKF
jgi:hypothetical protein